MIIDSHAHYCHNLYSGEFSYLDWNGADFVLARGEMAQMLAAMQRAGIGLCIEPGTSLEKAADQLALQAEFAPYFRIALGVHPKKCGETPWEQRETLRAMALENEIVAIGEAGLDYSVPPEELDQTCQQNWFQYQIELADECCLPLILHIRDAQADGLAILRQNRRLLHGGVAHCFGADADAAVAYVELGFALGIGGRLLQGDCRALEEAVKAVPLSALLVETDAPYIRPDISHLPASGKQRKKVRNSSLILPAVLDRIADLRGEPRQAVEDAIYQNTLRVFRL